MKKVIIGICAFLFLIVLVLLGMTIQGRTARQTELENAMESSMEKTMQMLSATGDVKPVTDEEMTAYFMEALAVQIQSASTLTVQVLEADVNKGLLSAEGILTYQHPIGTTGNVSCKKTILLEQYRTGQEADTYTIQFLAEGEIFKTYTLSKGSAFINPGIPQGSNEKTFAYWESDYGTGSFEALLGTGTVTEDLTLFAVFESLD